MSEVLITRYRTGFKVQCKCASLLRELNVFNEDLKQPKLERRHGRVFIIPGDNFYIEARSEDAIYYIDGLYDDVVRFIKHAGSRRAFADYTIKETRIEPHVGDDVVFGDHALKLIEPEDSEYVYQNDIVEYGIAEERPHTTLEVQTGKGKALCNSTPVKVPTGWQSIGELKVGDKVIAKDGTATEVLGVYPQGELQLYKVTFADGRWVECCAEHLWRVYYINTTVNRRWQVVNTLEMLRLISMPNPRVYIDLPDPEEGISVNLPMDPYTLGVAIGAQDKDTYLPAMYLSADRMQREALLRGLMYTADGVTKLHTGDTHSYTASSEQLANDVVYLVRSLGCIARTTVLSSADGVKYVVDIRMKHPSDQYDNILKLRVKSIVPTKVASATCITVAHPDKLFVCKDFIVTHNTQLSMKIAVKRAKRLLLITKAAYVDKWLGDLKDGLGLKPGELVRAKGVEGLVDLLKLGKEGKLNTTGKGERQVKAIVVSSHTLDDYISNYYLKFEGSTPPTDILRTLGIGQVVYDETHQLFRKNFWSFICLNPPRVLDLSATLTPDNEFLKHRYAERFPQAGRYDKLAFDAYIDAIGIMYGLTDGKIAQRVNRMSMYNHMMYEGYLSGSKKTKTAYFTMVNDVLKSFYFKQYIKGQKALVFFATQQMCTEFAQMMKVMHPTFVVKRYIQGDNYNDMQKGDIIVSTPGKSGTAVDIKGLVISVSTVMIDDTQANLQMLGRTRKDFKWNVTPKMVYLFCKSLQKHMKYHQKRLTMYKGKVKKHLTMNSSFRI